MFNAIAKRYDLLNRTLSLGIDVIWRNITVKAVGKHQP
ncbi:MAG: class I SAM-dependent methyltransferase, partial [Schleiferiaceae bacterium]|nr:class I SAM-dependent methyltransferase [Schleiferiaceae bacterium]